MVWYVPHETTPFFTEYKNIGNFDEGICIAAGLTLLYNINKMTPNSNLKDYGYIFSRIFGDAVLIDDNGSVTEDLIKRLPEILKRDAEARAEFLVDILNI